MEIFKRLITPVHPLSLQEEFAGAVARVESLRGRMERKNRMPRSTLDFAKHPRHLYT